MAAFLGDIAFLFGVVVAVAGLFTLHKATADPRPVLLKTAGFVLLAAGIGTALCTGYYYLKYHFAGDLEHPYPVMKHEMMMKKMMDKSMKDRQSPMDTSDKEEPITSPDISEEGHETHH